MQPKPTFSHLFTEGTGLQFQGSQILRLIRIAKKVALGNLRSVHHSFKVSYSFTITLNVCYRPDRPARPDPGLHL